MPEPKPKCHDCGVEVLPLYSTPDRNAKGPMSVAVCPACFAKRTGEEPDQK
ncbi:hypothetical protein [Oceanidesulfovibrio marinus]|uniref:hypothetical protein n=1 Tax=Oceanidesulfovibrio marinus TaxID=370038 RepID=UPI0012947BFF|nr:hypothetical protein [Oceanidesulfovibrio marinus]